MVSVKNTSQGPRGIRTADGDLVMIDAGQSASGDFPASEVKDFKAALAFEAGETPATAEEDDDSGSKEKPLAKMNKTELLAAADDAKITTAADADGNEVAVADATNPQLVAAIEKARAAK